MTPVVPALIFLTAFAVAWVGVGLVRRWTLRRQIFDIPNERSSHTEPTPRGGGIAIVVLALAGYIVGSMVSDVPISYGYVAGAVMISAISWLDDLISIPFWARLVVHIAGSALLIFDVGYWHEFFIPTADVTVPLGQGIGAVVTMGWLIWLINSYNFMDGIDGIAGIQAVVAGVSWTVFSAWQGLEGTFLFAGVLTSAAMGFLIHNWSPAKIFMGDVGSAFLGFTLAAIPLLARRELPDVQYQALLPAVAILFVWYFVFDSLLTFFRRLFRGHRVWEAHREHIYQRLVISGWSHARVALFYGTLAGLLSGTTLLAIIFSGKFPVFAILCLLISTTVLIYLAVEKKIDLSN